LVSVIHCVFVLFMVWAPFSNNRAALVMHLLLTPCLWIHWLLNDDTCMLTLVERRLRGVENNESFFYALVSPVYKVRDENIRCLSWAASVGLWLVTLCRTSKADVAAVLGFGLP